MIVRIRITAVLRKSKNNPVTYAFVQFNYHEMLQCSQSVLINFKFECRRNSFMFYETSYLLRYESFYFMEQNVKTYLHLLTSIDSKIESKARVAVKY